MPQRAAPCCGYPTAGCWLPAPEAGSYSLQQSGTCLDALVQCAGVHVRRGQAGQREGLSVHSKGTWRVCCVLYISLLIRGARLRTCLSGQVRRRGSLAAGALRAAARLKQEQHSRVLHLWTCCTSGTGDASAQGASPAARFAQVCTCWLCWCVVLCRISGRSRGGHSAVSCARTPGRVRLPATLKEITLCCFVQHWDMRTPWKRTVKRTVSVWHFSGYYAPGLRFLSRPAFPSLPENIGVRVHQQPLGAHDNSSASACELLRAGSLVCLNELRARVGCAWR